MPRAPQETVLWYVGIEPSSQPNFWFEIEIESDWKKLLHFCNTLWPNIKHLNALFLSGLGMYSTSLPSYNELANLFCEKLLNFGFGSQFSSQHRSIPSLIHVNIRAHCSPVLKSLSTSAIWGERQFCNWKLERKKNGPIKEQISSSSLIPVYTIRTPIVQCVSSFNFLGLTVPEKSVTKNVNVW